MTDCSFTFYFVYKLLTSLLSWNTYYLHNNQNDDTDSNTEGRAPLPHHEPFHTRSNCVTPPRNKVAHQLDTPEINPRVEPFLYPQSQGRSRIRRPTRPRTPIRTRCHRQAPMDRHLRFRCALLGRRPHRTFHCREAHGARSRIRRHRTQDWQQGQELEGR